MATIAAIMMFVPKQQEENILNENLKFNMPVAIISALIVGIGSGIVGAAGAFLLVPIMLVLLKIPTRVTIASSLAITFMSSIGSTVGKVVTNQVLYGPAIVMIIASLLAAPLGVKFGKRLNTKVLQVVLSILIFTTAVKMWLDIIV